MKKFITFILLVSLFACSDFLEEVPKAQLSESNFYTSLEDAQAAVNSTYTPIRGIFRTLYMLMLDIEADYADGRGSTRPLGDYQGFDVTNINRAATMWTQFYTSIRNANIAIQNIEGMDLDETSKAALIAEAQFMRAFSYYHLVRHWGAVPIHLSTETEDTERESPEEVYQVIISDLQAGETDLPNTPRQFGHPTRWAAKSLLAEVYLTLGEWASAKEKAAEVIESGEFSLIEVSQVDDFNNIFGPTVNGTSEEIFYLKYNHTDGWSWPLNLLWNDTEYGPFGNFVIYSVPGPFFDNWDDNDLRKEWNIFSEYYSPITGEIETLPEETPILCRKFRDPNATSREGYANDYPLLRYADVLLIYAEAAPKADGTVSAEAIEYLNMIRRRAYGYPSNSPSPVDFPTSNWTVESFTDTVFQERAYELYMEGKRWFDLKRVDKVQEIILQNTGKTVLDVHLMWPIPQQEIDTNPQIGPEDQNPGY